MKADPGWVVLQRQQPAMRVILAPRQGGAIRELSLRGRDVLRPTPAGAGDDPFDLACFPMVPYANRIVHGTFRFGGRDVRLQRNWSGDPHPLHGQGWRAAWSVVSASESVATLAFEGGGNEWPWPYRCEQRFELLSGALAIELSIQNLSAEPMPAMLGLHPYFPDAPHARLEAALAGVWVADEAAALTEVPVPAGWGFDPGRLVGDVPLDHCFSGWSGLAVLRWPHLTLQLRSPDCRFLHVYMPAGKDFFCAEPQSAAAGALGRPAEAHSLAPGERLAIHVQLLAEVC